MDTQHAFLPSTVFLYSRGRKVKDAFPRHCCSQSSGYKFDFTNAMCSYEILNASVRDSPPATASAKSKVTELSKLNIPHGWVASVVTPWQQSPDLWIAATQEGSSQCSHPDPYSNTSSFHEPLIFFIKHLSV